jgi:broad specificity phosphatase PhoE
VSQALERIRAAVAKVSLNPGEVSDGDLRQAAADPSLSPEQAQQLRQAAKGLKRGDIDYILYRL